MEQLIDEAAHATPPILQGELRRWFSCVMLHTVCATPLVMGTETQNTGLALTSAQR
jgi:hypothetical protein